MSLKYSVIEIYTSEETRYNKTSLYEAIISQVRGLKIAAHCMVLKGSDACYENGEIATKNLLTLSFNMPLKIEILLPSTELDYLLPTVEKMVDQGIIAVRELNIISFKTRKRLIPRQIRVRDIMTGSPETVSAETPASEVARMLLSAIFTGIPVVDKELYPVGIITQGDLIYRAGMPIRPGLLNESDSDGVNTVLKSMSSIKAGDIMTKPVITVSKDKQVTEAVNLMLEKKLKRLPVTGKDGILAGMLSRIDIFQTIRKESPNWDTIRKQNIQIENLHFVSDIMRRDTSKVLPETSIEEVIRIIDTDDIQRVAVVNDANIFKGLISDRALLTAFSDNPGILDYLSNLVPFSEKGQRHKNLQKKLLKKKASEIMETNIITVSEETHIDDAIRIMTEKGLKRLPVLDSRRRFKGMISRDALLRLGFS